MVNPVEHIRKRVFGLTQAAFAVVAGVSQATVSRWEKGDWEPNRDELAKIRNEAIRLGKHWDDSMIFEVPEGVTDRVAESRGGQS